MHEDHKFDFLLRADLGDHPKPATRDRLRSGHFFEELLGKGS
jgi:hypothetical protein